LVPTAADGVLSQLQAFDRVLRGAGTRIALSAPRVDLEHVEREPSSLFVDVGAALRRPDAGTGRPGDRVPSLKTLHRDAFAPARREAAVFRDAHPVSRAAWLDRAAASSSVPPGWREEELLDPERAGALLAPGKLGPADGLLPGGEPFPAVPGLTPERPISASGLADLLACPRYFLYRRVLGWDDPAEAPSLSELDPLTYGGLFHAAMEEFYRGHGKAFVAGEGALDRWQALADELASRRFGELLSEYPLVGAGIREKERLRLRDDVRSFLSYDFQPGRQRTFVDVERPFGVPEPVPLALGDRTLWVRGYIDRLDVEDGYTLVRDLKTGRSHPRLGDEAGPTPGRDLQLALYGIVTGKLARGWGLPGKVRVAYAYAGDRGHRERGFREDYALLEASGLEWLTLAARILAERAFVSTPEPGDCTYCSFRALCGAQIPARAAAGLRGRKGVLGAFRQLKSGPEEVG
ncbi:MAG TPA: PD-(D/E)XK nuclease family protein, partial [Anaeromyxobacter sp.]|nr:PD-(D/E)XK nuclease family protein [Anaeromyxobacter sp.]